MKKNIAMKKKSLLAAAVLSTLVCPAYMGRAAAADSADAGTIKARDVVVTASRTEQEIRQTPTAVEVIIREGRKNQVKRMLSKIGHPVIALHRCRFGELRLGDLAEGSWRELTDEEVASLKSAPRLDL